MWAAGRWTGFSKILLNTHWGNSGPGWKPTSCWRFWLRKKARRQPLRRVLGSRRPADKPDEIFGNEEIVKKNKKKKLKTHRGAAKRFKISSTGKIMRWHSGKRHLLGTKKPRRMRKLANAVVVNPSNVRNIRLALPYGIE